MTSGLSSFFPVRPLPAACQFQDVRLRQELAAGEGADLAQEGLQVDSAPAERAIQVVQRVLEGCRL